MNYLLFMSCNIYFYLIYFDRGSFYLSHKRLVSMKLQLKACLTLGTLLGICSPTFAQVESLITTTQPVFQVDNWTTSFTDPLPVYVSPPTINLGGLNGSVTDTSVTAGTTALRFPFQTGASISDTQFGVMEVGYWYTSLDAGANLIDSITNKGPWSVTAIGTLPGFTTPPTVNLGTISDFDTDKTLQCLKTVLGVPYQQGGALPLLAGAATDTSLQTLRTSLGSPFQSGASIGST